MQPIQLTVNDLASTILMAAVLAVILCGIINGIACLLAQITFRLFVRTRAAKSLKAWIIAKRNFRREARTG